MPDSAEPRSGALRALLHRLGPLLVVLVFASAAVLLYRQVSGYSIEEIRKAILKVPRTRIVLSCILTVFNYAVLIGYDVLAVKSVAHPLPLRRVALASFTGFATSYSFGALLGGGSVRFRLYSAWGLTPGEIVQLVVILGVTFWFGVFALAGVIFIIHPFPISSDIGADLHLPFDTTFPLGFPLILMAAAYLLVTAAWKKPINIGGKPVKLPGFRMSAAQLAVAAGDLVVAAECFHVLFPPGSVSYLDFLGIYLLAIVVVVLSHVPGGVAVFDVIILKMCPVAQKEAVLAAILLFRVIYYLLPLLAAAALLSIYELRLRSAAFRRLLGKE